MKLTKYKDMIGQASADKIDIETKGKLDKFLERRGVPKGKYSPIGIATDFYSGEYHYSILCKNPKDPSNKVLIKLQIFPEITQKEFSDLAPNYSSFVVINHGVDPNNIQDFMEEFEGLDEDE